MQALSYGNILKFGALLSLSLCLYTTLMWLTKLDSTYLSVGQYLDMAVALLPIGLILAAIAKQRALGRLTVLQRLGVSVGVAFVAQVIYAPFLYYYHNHINPEWFSYVLTTKRVELEAASQSAQSIATELTRMKTVHAQQLGMFSGFLPSVLIFPVLVALLSMLIIRDKTATELK